MSAPSMPPDRSVEVEQARISAENQRRAEENAKAEARKQELAGLRSSAGSNARTMADQYFTGRGLTPGDYSSDIDSTIQSILGGIGMDDPNPGSYFKNVGETAYQSAQTGYRTKQQRELDKLFSPNFETARVPFTIDDPYLASIEAEQRSEADQIIRNMLDRGVITPTGYSAATADLERQAPGARSRLNEVGTTTVAQGQQRLKDVANRGRQSASTLELGNFFDPRAFGSEADQAFNDFIGSLGDTIRSKLPGKLFSTAGLGAIAGAGQGAQNTNFDPNAQFGGPLAEDEDDTNKETIF